MSHEVLVLTQVRGELKSFGEVNYSSVELKGNQNAGNKVYLVETF